jgi:hypothetical protein
MEKAHLVGKAAGCVFILKLYPDFYINALYGFNTWHKVLISDGFFTPYASI